MHYYDPHATSSLCVAMYPDRFDQGSCELVIWSYTESKTSQAYTSFPPDGMAPSRLLQQIARVLTGWRCLMAKSLPTHGTRTSFVSSSPSSTAKHICFFYI